MVRTGDRVVVELHRRANEADGARSLDARFPADDRAVDLVAALAQPRPVRDLGVLDAAARQRAGLEPPSARLIVETDHGRRELVVGERVGRDNARQVMDPSTGRGWVLPGGLVDALEAPESIMLMSPPLPLMSSVQRIVVTTPGGSVTGAIDSREPCAEHTRLATAALARLYVYDYATDVDPASLQLDVRSDLFGTDGARAAFIEVLRAPDGARYLRSDRIQPLARLDPTLLDDIKPVLDAVRPGACDVPVSETRSALAPIAGNP